MCLISQAGLSAQPIFDVYEPLRTNTEVISFNSHDILWTRWAVLTVVRRKDQVGAPPYLNKQSNIDLVK